MRQYVTMRQFAAPVSPVFGRILRKSFVFNGLLARAPDLQWYGIDGTDCRAPATAG